MPEGDPGTAAEPESPVPALVRVAERMNRGRAKRIWSGYQRQVGARFVWWAVHRALRVHGLEALDAVDRSRPLLLVANHRTIFDLFAVATVLVRERPGPWRFYFPVRGRYCYHSARGALLNAAVAGWSMYPPFFREPGTKALDRRMLDRLIALASDGAWQVIGFHPEGTRNRSENEWELLPPHPGVGQLVLAARPQIIPVFVAGLSNDLPDQIRAGRRGDREVRVRFGPMVAADAWDGLPHRARGYMTVAQDLMRRIGDLAAQDRARHG